LCKILERSKAGDGILSNVGTSIFCSIEDGEWVNSILDRSLQRLEQNQAIEDFDAKGSPLASSICLV